MNFFRYAEAAIIISSFSCDRIDDLDLVCLHALNDKTGKEACAYELIRKVRAYGIMYIIQNIRVRYTNHLMTNLIYEWG